MYIGNELTCIRNVYGFKRGERYKCTGMCDNICIGYNKPNGIRHGEWFSPEQIDYYFSELSKVRREKLEKINKI